MQLPYSWIKELVDIDWSPQELGERLTFSGAEAEAEEMFAGQLDNIVVGHIIEIGPIEGTDHLQKAIVDDGAEKVQVVCGAPNAAKDQKIVLAKVGAVLQGDFKIKKAKLRGVESFGMICSERELGLSEDHSGIMVLDDDAPIGTPIGEYLNLNDWTIIFDLTPNRMDMLGAVGVARDLSCLSGKPVKRSPFELKESSEKTEDYIKISIDDPEACPRYAARMIKGVKIGPSPWHIKQRLIFSGIRPINIIVDVTNLVMMEYGHPMHAFDYNNIKTKKIVVRRALEGEEFTTLDGNEHKLSTGHLMITDGEKSVGVGGVMGGLNSEVSDDTTDILLEAAYFNPVVVRRGRQKLGLNTDASHRFERGCDPNIIPTVLDRAASMIAQYASGEVLSGIADCYPNEIKPTVIRFRPERANALLGTNIPRERIINILRGIDMGITGEDVLEVSVPTWQPEITREVDLIEEIIRIEGYDKLPDADNNKGPLRTYENADDLFREGVKSCLTTQGFDEIYGAYLADAKLLENLTGELPQLRILNPIAEDLSVLQNSAIYSVLKAVSHNIAMRNVNVKLFEVGKAYFPGEPPKEVEQIALAVTGINDKVWYGGGDKTDFHDIVGALETLSELCRLPEFKIISKDMPLFERGLSFEIVLNDKVVGSAGQVNSKTARTFDIKQPVLTAEIDFAEALKSQKSRQPFNPLPKFPAAPRDLAVVLDKSISSGDILSEIYKIGGEILEKVSIFDLYTGKQIEAGKKSLAFAFVYRADGRSLKSSEVQKVHEKVAEHLKQKFNAEVREG